MFDLSTLVRPHLPGLKPYSSARDEFDGLAEVMLDANENPLGSVTPTAFNRYPDPYQHALKTQLAALKGVTPSQIFLGNGSDEAIDLLYRAFAEPGHDNVVLLPPTYGMYQVSADINRVATRAVNLTPQFQMEPQAVLAATDAHTKIIWLCSPNNPSGNLLQIADIEHVLRHFSGLVVVDEAYIDFSPQPSWVQRLAEFPNLVVLQTFSKAWGLAGLRLGMLFASAAIVAVINKIKPPYNINQLTQELALAGLAQVAKKAEMVAEVLAQRDLFTPRLAAHPLVQTVYPSQANFWLVKMHRQAREIYEHLVAHQIVVRDRSKVPLCENCLRITVGTGQENERLLAALGSFAG